MQFQNDKNLTLELSNTEYGALNDIRGMREKAHYLVMTADFKTVNNRTKVVLNGNEEDFRDLYDEINEIVGEGYCPKSDVPRLERIYKKLAKSGNPYGIVEYY